MLLCGWLRIKSWSDATESSKKNNILMGKEWILWDVLFPLNGTAERSSPHPRSEQLLFVSCWRFAAVRQTNIMEEEIRLVNVATNTPGRSEAQTSVSSYHASPRPPALPDIGPDIHRGEPCVIMWPPVIVIKSKQMHPKKEKHKWLCWTLKQTVWINIIRRKKHLSIISAGISQGKDFIFVF